MKIIQLFGITATVTQNDRTITFVDGGITNVHTVHA